MLNKFVLVLAAAPVLLSTLALGAVSVTAALPFVHRAERNDHDVRCARRGNGRVSGHLSDGH
jgi:hypothetical protein